MFEIWTIAWSNLVRIARQPLMLFTTLALPFIVITIVGVALSGSDNTLQLGLNNRSTDPLSQQLVAALSADPALDVVLYDDRESLEQATRRGQVAAGVVIEADFGTLVAAGDQASLTFLTTPDQVDTATLRTVVASSVDATVQPVQAALFSQLTTGRPVGEETVRAADLAASVVAPQVVTQQLVPTSDTRLGFDYTAPSNLVLFIIITSLTGAAALIDSRTRGITRRLYSFPIRRSVVVAGEFLGRMVIALTQAAIILLGSWLVFGVVWGDPLGVAAVTVVFCAVGAALGLLLGFLATSTSQASSFGPPLGIVLGMLGGCMWPLSIVGDTVAAIGHVSPNAWAMDGYLELINADASLVDVLPMIGVLAGFAVLLLLASRVVVRPGSLR